MPTVARADAAAYRVRDGLTARQGAGRPDGPVGRFPRWPGRDADQPRPSHGTKARSMSHGTTDTLDEATLERLYLRLERPMVNVVYRWLWSLEEAQDVVQEAFLRVWRMREQVELTTVEPLLYRIALNLASKRRRSRKLWRWVSLEAIWDRPSAAHDAEQLLDDHQQQRAVRDAVDQLPEGLRRIVMLCEFSDLTQRQIGELLSIPPGTVGSRRHKALELLRQQLDGAREDAEPE